MQTNTETFFATETTLQRESLGYPSKLTQFNTGILTSITRRAILVKIPIEMCQFTRISQ